jgi:hypothetical protein
VALEHRSSRPVGNLLIGRAQAQSLVLEQGLRRGARHADHVRDLDLRLRLVEDPPDDHYEECPDDTSSGQRQPTRRRPVGLDIVKVDPLSAPFPLFVTRLIVGRLFLSHGRSP